MTEGKYAGHEGAQLLGFTVTRHSLARRKGNIARAIGTPTTISDMRENVIRGDGAKACQRVPPGRRCARVVHVKAAAARSASRNGSIGTEDDVALHRCAVGELERGGYQGSAVHFRDEPHEIDGEPFCSYRLGHPCPGHEELRGAPVAATLDLPVEGRRVVTQQLGKVLDYLPDFFDQVVGNLVVELSAATHMTNADARSIADQVRRELARAVSDYGISEIHLFAAVPQALAVMIGRGFNAMPPVHLYEYEGGEYHESYVLRGR